MKKIIKFKVLIDTYEKPRAITVNAYTIHHAIHEATNFCRNYEEIIEISRDGIILWRHPYIG